MTVKLKRSDVVLDLLFPGSDLPERVLSGEITERSALPSLTLNQACKLAELYFRAHTLELVVAKEPVDVLNLEAAFSIDREPGVMLGLKVDGAVKDTLIGLASLRVCSGPKVSIGIDPAFDDEKIHHLAFWYGANLVTREEIVSDIKVNSLFS